MLGAKLRNDQCEAGISEIRKASGFETNVEKVDRSLNVLSECIDVLISRLNCTLVPSIPLCGDEGKKGQNEPVLSEFEAVMRMFADRIQGLTERVTDVTSRCTL